MTEDIFSDTNKVKSNFIKWETVGQAVQGVLVDKKTIPNKLSKTPGGKQTIYTVLLDDGTTVLIAGRGQQNPQVIPGLESCKIGQLVGVKYTGDKDVNQPQPAKIIEVYTKGEMALDKLNSYRGLDSSEIALEEINFQ